MPTQSAPTEEEEWMRKWMKEKQKALEKTKEVAEEYDNLFNKLEAGQGLTTEEAVKLVEDFEYLVKVPLEYEEAYHLARDHIFTTIDPDPYECTVDYFGVDPDFKHSIVGVGCPKLDRRAYVFTNAKSYEYVKGIVLFDYAVNEEPLVLHDEDAVRAAEALATVFNLGLGGLLGEPVLLDVILDRMKRKEMEPVTKHRYECRRFWPGYEHYEHGSAVLIKCYDYSEFPEKLEPTGPPWYIITSPKHVYVVVKDEYQGGYKVKEINDEKAVNFIRKLFRVFRAS